MLTPSDSLHMMVRFAKHQVDRQKAEKFYQQALFLAESAFGKDSPQAGIVVLSLMDFYDSQNREQESKDAQARIRGILVKNAHLFDGLTGEPV